MRHPVPICRLPVCNSRRAPTLTPSDRYPASRGLPAPSQSIFGYFSLTGRRTNPPGSAPFARQPNGKALTTSSQEPIAIGALRHVESCVSCSRHLNVRPECVEIGAGKNAKPELAGVLPPLQFNLCHSYGLATLAITQRAPLGIDIGMIRPFAGPIE